MSRAVRGHLLVDSVLNTILTSDTYGIPLRQEANRTYYESDSDEEHLNYVAANETISYEIPQEHDIIVGADIWATR